MVHRLELALGRPFATSQRLDLETAARTALEKLRPDRDDFIRSVSRITGMPSQEISAVMASGPARGGSRPLTQCDSVVGGQGSTAPLQCRKKMN